MSLKLKAVVGAMWTVASSVGGRAVGLVGTLALTHFVAPEEYGMVSVGAVLVATVNGLTTLGFGQYVTAHPDADESTVFHATFIHLVTGIVAFAGLLAIRNYFDAWFDAPGMAVLLPGIVLATALERLAYMPGRVLAGEMRFRVLAMRLLFGELAYAGVAVLLAMRGFGAVSLVWGILARQSVAVVITVGALNYKRWLAVGPLRLETARKMLSFSVPMAAASWLQWLSRRGDNLIIAALFGPAAVGKYNLAYNLADVPATQVGEHIGDVLLPSFANMKSHGARRRTFVRASGLLALLVFPLAIGLAAIAPALVRAILGDAWWSLTPMLVVLSALSVMRPVGWLVSAYLQAKSQTKTLFWLEVIKVVAVGGLVLLLGQVSVLWACAGVGVAFAIHSAASLWVVHRDENLSISMLTKPYLRPLLACLPMALCVVGATRLADHFDMAPWVTLLLALGSGVVSYVAAALTVASVQAKDLLSLVRDALGRGRDTETRPVEGTST